MNQRILFIAIGLVVVSCFSTQAQAGFAPIPYWRIDESYTPKQGDPYGDYTPAQYRFEITNQHTSESIIAFAVGINLESDPDASIDMLINYPEWRCEVIESYKWDDSAWTYSGMVRGEDSTAANFFGMSWEEIFGDGYNKAAVYWGNQDLLDDPTTTYEPGAIEAGYSSSDYSWMFGYDLYSSEIPMSPAAVVLGDYEGFDGETDVDNVFPTNTVPAPGAILLGSIGACIVGLLRRCRTLKVIG